MIFYQYSLCTKHDLSVSFPYCVSVCLHIVTATNTRPAVLSKSIKRHTNTLSDLFSTPHPPNPLSSYNFFVSSLLSPSVSRALFLPSPRSISPDIHTSCFFYHAPIFLFPILSTLLHFSHSC